MNSFKEPHEVLATNVCVRYGLTHFAPEAHRTDDTLHNVLEYLPLT